VTVLIGAHLPAVVLAYQWQRREFAFNILLFAARVAALSAGTYYGNALLAVMLYSTIGAVMQLLFRACWLVGIGCAPTALLRTVAREMGLGVVLAFRWCSRCGGPREVYLCWPSF